MGCVGYRYNIKRAGNFDPSQRLSCIVMKLLRYQEQTNRKSQLLVSGNPSSKHSSSTSCPDSTAEQTSDAVLQLHTTSPYLFQPVSGLGSCDLSFQDPRDSDPYPKHYLKINQTNRHFYPFSPNLNETAGRRPHPSAVSQPLSQPHSYSDSTQYGLPCIDRTLPSHPRRRKLLSVGINYFGQKGQLKHSIKDVKNMAAYLHQCLGHSREDTVILTDDQLLPFSQPTKANILRAMKWLVMDARANDSLVFHYSGHGVQEPRTVDSQDDHSSKSMYPVDFRSSGRISGDEVYEFIIRRLPRGVKLTIIHDTYQPDNSSSI